MTDGDAQAITAFLMAQKNVARAPEERKSETVPARVDHFAASPVLVRASRATTPEEDPRPSVPPWFW